LQDCIAAASNPNPMPIRTPVLGPCIRNQPDACTSDADCTTGGCGGEVCHGVGNDVTSTCDCTAPQGISCGCVNGSCSWWQCACKAGWRCTASAIATSRAVAPSRL
jgi:eight-cysteine-cluster-containing protein